MNILLEEDIKRNLLEWEFDRTEKIFTISTIISFIIFLIGAIF